MNVEKLTEEKLEEIVSTNKALSDSIVPFDRHSYGIAQGYAEIAFRAELELIRRKKQKL